MYKGDIPAALASAKASQSLIMIFLRLLLIVILVQVSARGYSQITLHQDDASLETVLQTIEKQTSYVFLYTDADIAKTKISIKLTNASIEQALQQCFLNLPYTYKILDKNILIKREDVASSRIRPDVNEGVTVQGTVRDAKGALPGVGITLADGAAKTITDTDGHYFIRVPSRKSVLIFSFLGYEAQRQAVEERLTINVVLTENTRSLTEVIVVGYGNQKKGNVLGAISSLNVANLKVASTSNLTNSIAGRVPGILARMGDGNIGGGTDRFASGTLDDAQIVIRGKASVNGSQPLIFIDGMESSFSRINPDDIEQFTVLKDASSTAVYGARGANGVILVTTRKGTTGRPKLSFNSQLRMHKPIAFPTFLGAYDYATLYNEALRNEGKPPLYTGADLEHYRKGDSPDTHSDIDWHKLLIRDHFFEQSHTLNVKGGTEKVQYYIGGEYNGAGGPFKGSKMTNETYDRFNLRTNLDFLISKSTQLDIKLNGRLEDKNSSNHGENTGNRYIGTYWYDLAIKRPVDGQLYNPNGTYAYGPNLVSWNSLADLNDGGYIRRFQNTIESNFTLRQKLDFIIPGLSLRGMYGLVSGSGSRKTFLQQPELWDYNYTTQTYTLKRAKPIPVYTASALSYGRREQVEVSANYEKGLGSEHKIGAMGIYTQSATTLDAVLPITYRGVAGRISYAFKDRYLAELSAGYNGSNQFAKGKRYALFPAAAMGWVISQENFIQNRLKFIDYLKVRGSYGFAGSDQVGNNRFLYRYEFVPQRNRFNALTGIDGADYNFGVSPTTASGLSEGTIGSENVSWEIARKANVGLDIKMFHNRLVFTTDVFREKRSNILTIRQDIPTFTGLNSGKLPAENVGRTTNKGVEFELAYNRRYGGLDLSFSANYTFARSNIDFIAEQPQRYAYRMRTNHRIGQEFGYVWTGKFYDFPDIADVNVPKPVGARPGDLVFEDVNRDGVIDDFDQAAIGYSDIPEEIFAFNMGLSFKGFSLNTFWQGASNVTTRVAGEIKDEFSPNIQPRHLGRWVYDPDRGLDTRATATYPALIIGGSAVTSLPSSFHALNAEYLRLKTAELSYNFPEASLKKIRLSSLKAFLSGSNLITMAHFNFVDPEYRSGARGNYFPQTKFYALGFNAVF